MRSRKSASGSGQRVKGWRLSKTLKRHTEFRPLVTDDVRYAYAAYKMKGLGVMQSRFAPELSAEGFAEAFAHEIATDYDAGWTLLAETPKGFIPVGMIFGFFAHPTVNLILLSQVAWFPWASPRNVIEAAVRFGNTIRRVQPLMAFVHGSSSGKSLFVALMKHGIVRQVGTSMTAVPGEASAVYETVQRSLS